jgi:hypothetical protein
MIILNNLANNSVRTPQAIATVETATAQ